MKTIYNATTVICNKCRRQTLILSLSSYKPVGSCYHCGLNWEILNPTVVRKEKESMEWKP